MLKKTHYYGLALVLMAVVIIGAAVIENNWLSVGFIGALVFLIQIAKRNTEGMKTDERVYRIARKAARKAFLVYFVGGALGGGFLVLLEINKRLTFLGQVWCYSGIVLFLIYFVFYLYYKWKM